MPGKTLGNFLGKEGRSYSASVTSENKTHLRLYRRAARLASEVLSALKTPRSDRQKVVSSLLFNRLFESTQAGVHLVRRGFERDASALIRISFEALVFLKGCCAEENFVDEYLRSGLIGQRKLARNSLKIPDLSDEQRRRLQKQVDVLGAHIIAEGATELKMAAVAHRFGLSDFYEGIYRVMSSSVHSNPRVLLEFMQIEEGKITGIPGPSKRYAPLNLYWLTYFLLLGIGEIINLFALPYEARWNSLHKDLERNVPNWVGTIPGGISID